MIHSAGIPPGSTREWLLGSNEVSPAEPDEIHTREDAEAEGE